MKHKPTPLPMREAALRHVAERLLADAKTWGYTVTIGPDGTILLRRLPTPA